MSYKELVGDMPDHTIEWLNLPSYKVYDAIAALDLPAHAKSILHNVVRHTQRNPDHERYGKAWLPQEDIAKETGIPPRTVSRTWQLLTKGNGFIKSVAMPKGHRGGTWNLYEVVWEAIDPQADYPERHANVADGSADEYNGNATASTIHTPNIPIHTPSGNDPHAKRGASTRHGGVEGFKQGSKGGNKQSSTSQRSADDAAFNPTPQGDRESKGIGTWLENGWMGSLSDVEKINCVLRALGRSESELISWLGDTGRTGGAWLVGKTYKRLAYLADRLKSSGERCAANQFMKWEPPFSRKFLNEAESVVTNEGREKRPLWEIEVDDSDSEDQPCRKIEITVECDDGCILGPDHKGRCQVPDDAEMDV